MKRNKRETLEGVEPKDAAVIVLCRNPSKLLPNELNDRRERL